MSAPGTTALQAVAELRRQQIERYGHTPEADANTSLMRFARLLQNYATAVMEDAQFGRPATQMRLHTVKLGALALAAIDRIDLEIAREAQAQSSEQDPPW